MRPAVGTFRLAYTAGKKVGVEVVGEEAVGNADPDSEEGDPVVGHVENDLVGDPGEGGGANVDQE
ncbi:hypothetical protein HUJ04_007686 [Dendroctonus ponderosae]|nr:hypothetical protein HUJ04_007686 [Dendroctonus ponderosae]